MSRDHETCSIHPHVTLVVFCPACRGSRTSESKALTAKKNGARGGRPKKRAKRLSRNAAK